MEVNNHMELKEVKEFIEQNKENEEVKAYLQGLSKVDVARMQTEAESNQEIKSWLDSIKDKHASKSLETWKTNNLQKLIDEAVSKANPKETPEAKQIRELTERLNKKEADEQRQILMNKALLKADEKKLPKEIVSYFLGEDEDSTTTNLTKLEEIFNNHISKEIEERLKGGYKPPKNEDNKTDISKMSMEEYAEYWKNQNK